MYTSKHSRGKTFAVHQQFALCRENFRGLQPTRAFAIRILECAQIRIKFDTHAGRMAEA